MSIPSKICPRCGRQAILSASACVQCGHVYRTKFEPEPDPTMQTRMYQAPPVQQAPGQMQYQQPQQGYRSPDTIQVQPGYHNVTNAIILSALLIGAGQMYNKQVTKGILMLIGSIAVAGLTFGFGLVLMYGISIYDTIQVAKRLNRGEPVGQWQFF